MEIECQPLSNFGSDWKRFLEQDPLCIFTKGACHAFAIELHAFLDSSMGDGAVRLFGLKQQNPMGGDHVVVGIGDKFLDVTKTLRNADALSAWVVPEEISIDELVTDYDVSKDLSPARVPRAGARKSPTTNPLRGLREKVPRGTESKNEVKEAVCFPSNRFGHLIAEPFFTRAREMARSSMEAEGSEYLRLARKALAERGDNIS